jgi:hypothetical protein
MKKKASSSSVLHAHALHANSEGRANHRGSEMLVETPSAPSKTPTAANNTVRKLVQESTESANALKNVDTAGKPSEQKRREVKRIRHTTADQPNEAQVSLTPNYITESNNRR